MDELYSGEVLEFTPTQSFGIFEPPKKSYGITFEPRNQGNENEIDPHALEIPYRKSCEKLLSNYIELSKIAPKLNAEQIAYSGLSLNEINTNIKTSQELGNGKISAYYKMLNSSQNLFVVQPRTLGSGLTKPGYHYNFAANPKQEKYSQQSNAAKFWTDRDYMGIITAEDLPELVLPFVDMLQDVKPDRVLVCDRTARPIGKAIEAVFEAQDEQLPTEDGLFHYRKVTGKYSDQSWGHGLTFEDVYNHISDILEEAKSIGEQESRKPRIVVIDDWQISGTTQAFFERACAHAGIEVDLTWAVLTGKKGHFCANPSRLSRSVEWADNPDVIGVDYDGVTPIDKTTERSVTFYETMHAAARKLVGKTTELVAV